MPNQHETSGNDNSNESAPPPFLTQRKVFWFGIVSMFTALEGFILSHDLHENVRRVNDACDWVVWCIDASSMIATVLGMIVVVVCHWFPDRRHKFLWRRRKWICY